MVVVHEAEVDGVRCFWVETGRPTLQAWLRFRIGMVDETIETSGWLHLLEHLALHGAPTSGALAVNGSVSLRMTTFEAHGPAASVTEHLAHRSLAGRAAAC